MPRPWICPREPFGTSGAIRQLPEQPQIAALTRLVRESQTVGGPGPDRIGVRTSKRDLSNLGPARQVVDPDLSGRDIYFKGACVPSGEYQT